MLETLGSDMECFAKNKDGHHVALCGKIGGTKEQPIQLKHLPKGYMVQEDNVAAEFNIPVCNTCTDFVEAFSIMRGEITGILDKLALTISDNASYSFDKTELTHPKALIFGCEPDFDAWSKKENRKPFSEDDTLRTCGGHIHVGSNIDMVAGVRNMDLFLGVPAVILDNTPASIARRVLYGKAGAMRPKPYGWEYRTLSNFWMFKDVLVEWVYNQTKRACEFSDQITIKEGELIQACINTGNMDIAKSLVEKYNIEMPKEKYVKPVKKAISTYHFSKTNLDELLKQHMAVNVA